jgi:hypothetical protein
MNRKVIVTLFAGVIIGMASIVAASAHGGGGHGGGGGGHGGGGWRGGWGGVGWGGYPYYYDGPYYDEGPECYLVRQRVKTRHGWRIRRFRVCQ